VERLWSPWRMEYLESARDEDEEKDACVFCALLELDDPEGARVLARDGLAFVALAKYPYNPGHLLVLPVRHAGDLEDLSTEESAAITNLIHRSLRAVRATSDPEGFNVGLNLGRAAGAGIPGHLHWHVVPRWEGDTNFMPVVGQTRVLPELLEQTYAKLRSGFAED
jgi:ATP adenylyltransferase